MNLLSGVLELLFPSKCVFCRHVLPFGARGMCDACRKEQLQKRIEKRGTFFYRCVVSLDYNQQVRDAIHRFKFGDQPGYAEAFGKIMAQTIDRELPGQYDMITWIPVSAKRCRTRGYDQSLLLAQAAAEELGQNVVPTLEKTMDNPAQSTLRDAKERKSNVKGAYLALDCQNIEGKRVLVVDDVITTGATMEEAARTLLRAGASLVLCAALASPEKT